MGDSSAACDGPVLVVDWPTHTPRSAGDIYSSEISPHVGLRSTLVLSVAAMQQPPAIGGHVRSEVHAPSRRLSGSCVVNMPW